MRRGLVRTLSAITGKHFDNGSHGIIIRLLSTILVESLSSVKSSTAEGRPNADYVEYRSRKPINTGSNNMKIDTEVDHVATGGNNCAWTVDCFDITSEVCIRPFLYLGQTRSRDHSYTITMLLIRSDMFT